MQKLSEIMSIEDIVYIKIYARYAILMPIYEPDTALCLGYTTAPNEALSVESFTLLFSTINDNGRYWKTLEDSFKERCDCMVELHQNHSEGLIEAEKLAEQMASAPPSDPIDQDKLTAIYKALNAYWYDLIYEEGKNYATLDNLERFTDRIIECNAELQKKLGFIEQLPDPSTRSLLLALEDDFKFILSFSTNAESGCHALWTQWTQLSTQLEEMKDAALAAKTHEDIAELWINLVDINLKLANADEETRYIQTCFYGADDYYANTYPAGFVPLGEYLETCKDVEVILKAECKTASGGWNDDTLAIESYDPLKTEVSNENGQLHYTNDYPIQTGYSYFPGGNYRETCRNLQVIVTASCKTNSGSYQTSSIKISNKLNARLINVNGVLKEDL